MRGESEFPEDVVGPVATGDVPYHLIAQRELDDRASVSVMYNPSHLDVVNPVAMGRTRGLQRVYRDGDYADAEAKKSRWTDKVLNVQIHGDAAYAAARSESGVPGVVGCAALRGRRHRAPRGEQSIGLHGDGRHRKIVEMVVKATRIAFNYQRKFRKDVFVDLNCFRRWGHTEPDDPTYTNPLVYNTIINNRPSIPDRYLERLIESKVLSDEEATEMAREYTSRLNEGLKRADDYVPEDTCCLTATTGPAPSTAPADWSDSCS
uniref:Dehydrogenase E1 component domain-containing protein n=1 Tax=Trichogramma kaykai TaxID=54128 RepID=A0ABD2VZI4_9HYME